MTELTHDRVMDLFDYNPFDGLMRWRKRVSNISAGSVAGCLAPDGYIKIRVDGVLYQSARLIWFYMTGKWPVDEVDHKNRVRTDDRWENLREASHAQNMTNQNKMVSKISGVRGVRWRAKSKKWEARIKIAGRERSLGLYTDFDRACEVRRVAAIAAFGEFACR